MTLVVVVVVLVLVVVPERVVEQLLALLANDWLLVATLDVMPLDSILHSQKLLNTKFYFLYNQLTHVVHVVQDTDARLVLAPLSLLPVVWLPLLQTPRVAPLTVAALPWGWDPLPGRRPVPTILNDGLEVPAVTALKQKILRRPALSLNPDIA